MKKQFSEHVAVLREVQKGEFIIVSFKRIRAGSKENPFTRLFTRQVLSVKPAPIQ